MTHHEANGPLVKVAVSVESVSVDAAAAGRDGRGTAQTDECGFGGDPVGVVTGAGQELAGDLGVDCRVCRGMTIKLPISWSHAGQVG